MTAPDESTIISAIRSITGETGYPPTPEEVADALGVTVKSVHSTLRGAKRRGAVRYDDAERFVLGDSA